MSTPQNIVESNESTERSLGAVNGFSTSDTEILTEAFYLSPMIVDAAGAKKMTDESVKKDFHMQVMRGPVIDSTGYWAFHSAFSRDYVGAPSYDFVWKAAGDPVNSFVPNIESIKNANPYNETTPGSIQQKYASNPARKGSAPFVGVGTNLSPHDSTQGLVSGDSGWGKDVLAETLGEYLIGESDATLPPVVPAKDEDAPAGD